MTRTYRKRIYNPAPSGRRVVPTTQGSSTPHPGRKTKGAICQMDCERLATDVLDVGLPFRVAVCGEADCRDAARRLGEDDE